ncbi:prepilin-type N-terminal cleavage/methylation domain-containing protein [Verrucomicrobium sp. BvORR034]|uniref:prepilin-type N-terminal cleavage/methylation domain-containing protein n=1 Tax=Verrucomicrobium sp. BvORR034 TaxID=1396418 RepID=UPI0006784A98|nr:prepilin-type N-terminal cleavage/methylation domain-containing protein [Verrucomicrobium sp. BvORR034]
MKIRTVSRHLNRRLAGGFTLIELLVVIAIIALLAALTLGGFQYAQQAAGRNKTTASLAAIKSGLEQYKEKFGEYPAVPAAQASDTGTYGGLTVKRAAAAMLYQALSGDGNTYIQLSGAAGVESDGEVSVEEVPNSINSNLPPQMIFSGGVARGTPGTRYLIDGFGRPFQYTKGGEATAVNPTYDIWSYGHSDKAGTPNDDLNTKKSATETATWIKNW